MDTYSANGETGNLRPAQSLNIFQTASDYGVETVYDIPVYNSMMQFIGLNCLNFEPGTEASLVNGAGTGWLAGTTGAYFTYLNAHANPNFTPSNGAYACGGGNDDIVRVGESQSTGNLSPFFATSSWDFNVLNELFDSMLQVNPETVGPGLQTYDWMTTSHSSNFNPAEISTSPGMGTTVGTTTQVWHLRPDAMGSKLTFAQLEACRVATGGSRAPTGQKHAAAQTWCGSIGTLPIRLL